MSIVLLNIQDALLNGDTKPLWDFLNAGGKVEDLGKGDIPFYACSKVICDLKLVKLLFERGMKLEDDYNFFYNQKNMSDEVFDWALQNNLDKAKTDRSVLFSLVSRPERFKRVVERGADIHVLFSENVPKTLITSAAAMGHKETVSFLVEKGADINEPLHDGWSAFLEAAYTNLCDADMLEHLVKLGADYRIRCKGQTVIMIASTPVDPEECHSVNKLKYLMSLYQGWAGEVDDKGNTALHLVARRNKSASVIELLLSKGFDPMMVNKEGKTPIEICISQNTPESFKPFWSWIQTNPVRFANLGLQLLCEKHSADKINESINIRAQREKKRKKNKFDIENCHQNKSDIISSGKKMSPTLDEAYLALRDNNNVQPLKDYLAAGGRITKTFWPFYHFVPVVQDIELVKTLMDRGMTIVPYANFFTCIAEGMSDEVFRWALGNYFDKIEYDITTASYAYRHRERFVELLRSGMNIHAENKYRRETAMEYAVDLEDVAGIEFLCEQGFNINYMTDRTALLRACRTDVGVEIVKSMVRLGANPAIKTIIGKDAMMLICDRSDPGKSALEKIKYLSLVYPGWTSAQDDDGDTALHYAVDYKEEKGHLQIISLLLSLGADYTLKNRDDHDAVDVCCLRKNLDAFRCFWNFWKARSIPIDYPALFAKCEEHCAENIKQFLVETQLENMTVDVDMVADITQSVERQLDAMAVVSDLQ